MAKNAFQYGGWNSYTLECGIWPWNRDNEFTKWQHPAMWYVALGWHAIELNRWQHPAMWHVVLESWHRICQVAAPAMWQVAMGWHAIEFAETSAILKFYIWFRFRPHTSPPSTCHSAPVSEILSKSDHRRQKKMTSCRFSRWRISAILDFRDPIMDSLKSPIT